MYISANPPQQYSHLSMIVQSDQCTELTIHLVANWLPLCPEATLSGMGITSALVF